VTYAQFRSIDHTPCIARANFLGKGVFCTHHNEEVATREDGQPATSSPPSSQPFAALSIFDTVKEASLAYLDALEGVWR
jgi:hypothetical protein